MRVQRVTGGGTGVIVVDHSKVLHWVQTLASSAGAAQSIALTHLKTDPLDPNR
jgi:hypothetical protein